MPIDVIKEFNWVDIFILTLLFRVYYVSIKRGFVVEIFKLLGTVLGLYLSLHYYSSFSAFLIDSIGIKAFPVEALDFVVFLFLVAIGYLLFVLLRQTIFHLLKIESSSTLDKWGGLFLGLLRSILVGALAAYMLCISAITYINKSVNASYLGSRFLKVAPATYTWIWESVMSKFMTQEKFNSAVKSPGVLAPKAEPDK